MQQRTFYIASSFKNKNEVRNISKLLIDKGYIHTYDWTLNNRATSLQALEKIGKEELAAVKNSDFIIVILPAGKGSHIELGIAIGLGKKIFLYSPNKEVNNLEATSTFYHLPEVNKCYGEVEDLIETVIALTI